MVSLKNEAINQLLEHRCPKPESIPNIPLYMDQVQGYLEKTLQRAKLDENDKVLTKTMINNYVKAGILEKPKKKKYGKQQLMLLMMIYHWKNVLSLGEIGKLLFRCKNQGVDVPSIYRLFREQQNASAEDIKKKEPVLLDDQEAIENLLKAIVRADLYKRIALLSLNINCSNE